MRLVSFIIIICLSRIYTMQMTYIYKTDSIKTLIVNKSNDSLNIIVPPLVFKQDSVINKTNKSKNIFGNKDSTMRKKDYFTIALVQGLKDKSASEKNKLVQFRSRMFLHRTSNWFASMNAALYIDSIYTNLDLSLNYSFSENDSLKRTFYVRPFALRQIDQSFFGSVGIGMYENLGFLKGSEFTLSLYYDFDPKKRRKHHDAPQYFLSLEALLVSHTNAYEQLFGKKDQIALKFQVFGPLSKQAKLPEDVRYVFTVEYNLFGQLF